MKIYLIFPQLFETCTVFAGSKEKHKEDLEARSGRTLTKI